MKRIHIVGSGPRTGTTLITEMMISCFNIDLHTKHEDSIYVIPQRDADICLTKNPRDILVIEPVLRILPDLYVIYMLRDPRDTIVSRHGKDPDKYWAGLSFWKTYSPFGQRLESHPRFISIKYEDLVTRPDAIQDYLISRMPFLSKHADFSSYDQHSSPSKDSLDALGGLRPVSSSSIGNWRQHLPRVAGQLQLHGSITDDLIRYGYEQDGAWEKVLIGIQPDLSASHWPEFFSSYTLWKRSINKYPLAVKVLLGHYWPTHLRPRQAAHK